MPLSHVSGLYAVKDCKIAKMTADPAGGTATLATSIDVPGIKSLSISGEVNTAELRGDNTRLDYRSTLGGMEAEVEHAKLSLDVLVAIMGGAIVDTGVSPNQTAAYGLTSANGATNYFQLQAVTAGGDSATGDVLITLYKCVLTSFPDFGMDEEDFATSSFGIACLPRLADNKWMDVTFRETAAALA